MTVRGPFNVRLATVAALGGTSKARDSTRRATHNTPETRFAWILGGVCKRMHRWSVSGQRLPREAIDNTIIEEK